MKVLCILTDGFEDFEAFGTIALLRRAGIEVDVFSLHNNDALGRFNIHVTDLKNIDELPNLHFKDYNCLFIAGGPQYMELAHDDFFIDVIKKFYNKDKYIAAICAAPTILGKLGMLKGKKYTCFTSMDDNFGGTYCYDLAVKDANIITGKSVAAVYDFAFLLIKTLADFEVEQKIKKEIYYKG